MSEDKKIIELRDEELEKVSGGKWLYMNGESGVSICPFCSTDNEYALSRNIGYSAGDYIGTCTCGAVITLAERKKFNYAKNGLNTKVEF